MLKCRICILSILVFLSFTARGKHIYGGELLYTYISGNTYKLTLTLYANCAENATNDLYNRNPQISIRANNGIYTNTLLYPEAGTGYEVTPVCPSQINNTSCHGGTLPGVKKFVYTNTVELSSSYNNYTFIFNGSVNRSSNITNIYNPSSQAVYLWATLNTSQGPNSSPTYTTLPTPYYCINVAQQYNQGAIDPNSDSLYFELTPALVNGNPVQYNSGLSATQPMLTGGNFYFDNLNGQMSFTPTAIQNALIVNLVSEYKNGVLVGTSVREMTFIVESNCSNNPPGALLGAVAGGSVSDSNSTVINICEGTPQVSFSIHAADPDQQNVTATYTSLPAGATLNIAGNGGLAPALSFSWNTTNVAAGTYSFFVTYTDNGCPLTSKQTIAYTINIVKPNAVTYQVLLPPGCSKKAWVKLNFTNGSTPRSITILQNGNIIHSYNGAASSLTDSFSAGVYTIQMSSAGLACPSNATMVIVDSLHPAPLHADSVFYCKNAAAVPLTASLTAGGVAISWYNAAGTLLSTAPTPSTETAGLFKYMVAQEFADCASKKDTIYVLVTDRPQAGFTAPAELCSNDTVTISFAGTAGANAIYNWAFNNPVYTKGTAAGPYSLKWATAGIKTITLTIIENHCAGDTATRQVNVKTSPDAQFSINTYACITDSAAVSFTGINYPGTTYTWNFAGGAGGNKSLAGNFSLKWDTAGLKQITLTATNNGCISYGAHQITIYPVPDVQIENKAEKICIGDKIYLTATGAESYTWAPAERLRYDAGSAMPYVYVLQPTLFIVTGKSEYGCYAKDSVYYTDIEQCCHFSFPNAFTPNNDGNNDKFSVITYGNTTSYKLYIFDRWGRCIYNSFNPTDGWNGSYKGASCDAGTYYYLFEARCVTGHVETAKGDIILIR